MGMETEEREERKRAAGGDTERKVWMDLKDTSGGEGKDPGDRVKNWEGPAEMGFREQRAFRSGPAARAH